MDQNFDPTYWRNLHQCPVTRPSERRATRVAMAMTVVFFVSLTSLLVGLAQLDVTSSWMMASTE